MCVGTDSYDLSSYDAESANGDFGDFVNFCDSNPSGLFVDIGAGLRQVMRKNVLYLEVYPSAIADLIVSPSSPYPIKDNSVDGVGCFAVLEHVRRPWEVILEIKRILKPGGKVFIDWPFLQPVHGYPSHYFNATRQGLISLFSDSGFFVEKAETYPFQGPDHTVTWILSRLVKSISDDAVRTKFQNMTGKDLIDAEVGNEFWLEVLGKIPSEGIEELACGNCLIGSKGA